MSRRRLLALEAALIGAGVVAVVVILLWPFGSESEGRGTVSVSFWQTEKDLSNRTPEPVRCDFALRGQPLARHQILSYYGNPYTADMGIVGELEPEALVKKLKAHAQQYDALNGLRAVQPALDPEFAMPEGKLPGESIGSLNAVDVNAAQALLQNFLEERELPDKVLIVHQFTRDMLTDPELIEDYPRVRLVIDMDGFGPPHVKRVKYDWFAAPAEYSGIKLFFRHDSDLMSEQEVLELNPDVIIYQ